jgi:hypothetical protein
MTESEFIEELARLIHEDATSQRMRIRWWEKTIRGWLTRPLVVAATSAPTSEFWAALYPASARPGDDPDVIVPLQPDSELADIKQGDEVDVLGVPQVGHAIIIVANGSVIRPAGPATARMRGGPKL